MQASTGEPALLLDADHTQSEKVIGLRKRTFNAYRDETTSSESPVRTNVQAQRQPLVRRTDMKRSGRFSSHE